MKSITLSLILLALSYSCEKASAVPFNKKVARMAPSQGAVILCLGNSLTLGYHLPDPATQSYPAQLAKFQEFSSDTILNKGINGITTIQMYARVNVDVTPYISFFLPRMAIIQEIGNDIFWSGAKAWDAFSRFENYAHTLRYYGFNVVVMTNPERNNYFFGYAKTPGGDDSTVYQVKMDSANRLIREFWIQFANELADVAADPRLARYSPTYFLPDHVHLSAKGYAVEDSVIVKSIYH